MELDTAASPPIYIRLATAADADRISELVTRLAREFIAHEFSAEGRANLLNSMSPAAIERLLESGYRYYVAEAGNTLAGVVATRDDRHLYHLFVATEFQRQGLARRLWQIARDACTTNAGTREFTVNASSYAIAAYERLGFVVVGQQQAKNGVISVPMKASIAERHPSA